LTTVDRSGSTEKLPTSEQTTQRQTTKGEKV